MVDITIIPKTRRDISNLLKLGCRLYTHYSVSTRYYYVENNKLKLNDIVSFCFDEWDCRDWERIPIEIYLSRLIYVEG